MPHAFRKEAKTNGVKSLYQGALPFLGTYCAFVALQFTIYEKMVTYFKHSLDAETYARREIPVTCFSGFCGGVIGAAMTNALEAITVAKQTDPKTNIRKLITQEGASLLTKGIMARICYNGAQSLLFFTLVMVIGKAYDVELNDD